MSMQRRIEEKLIAAFAPLELEIVNESHKHQGHAGDDGSGETHFRVNIVSEAFQRQKRVTCQRMVYDALSEELSGNLHALALKTAAPAS